jgi:Mn-dependent DtxR family transcriptional regulator
VVKKARYNKEVLLNFFVNTLKLDENIAQTNACKVEHILSDEVIEGIKNMK